MSPERSPVDRRVKSAEHVEPVARGRRRRRRVHDVDRPRLEARRGDGRRRHRWKRCRRRAASVARRLRRHRLTLVTCLLLLRQRLHRSLHHVRRLLDRRRAVARGRQAPPHLLLPGSVGDDHDRTSRRQVHTHGRKITRSRRRCARSFGARRLHHHRHADAAEQLAQRRAQRRDVLPATGRDHPHLSRRGGRRDRRRGRRRSSAIPAVRCICSWGRRRRRGRQRRRERQEGDGGVPRRASPVRAIDQVPPDCSIRACARDA